MHADLYISVQHRKWRGIQKNHDHMKELILKLMENPQTEPEQLAQAHAMYSSICKALHGVSFVVENYLRTGVKPTQEQREECFPKFKRIACGCGTTYSVLKDDEWHRCPSCGML